MITREKIAGAVYGTALGDALGAPTEFMKLKEIYKRFGRTGVMRMPAPALFTDDTQMTIAVSRALTDADSLHPHEVARTLRKRFVQWAQVDPPRAPGVTCMRAIGKLRRGVRWQDATVVSSKGCGANMRVVPAAFLRDVRDAQGVAQLQAAMTHGHPTALAAAELTAMAVRLAAEVDSLDELPAKLLLHAHWRMAQDNPYRADWLGKFGRRHWTRQLGVRENTTRGWDDCAQAIMKAVHLLYEVEQPRDVCRVTGEGWVADEALATALYYAVRYADDPALGISEAARTSGDSDSLASIAGAILGAHHGDEVWPLEWRRKIERRWDLECVISETYSRSR